MHRRCRCWLHDVFTSILSCTCFCNSNESDAFVHSEKCFSVVIPFSELLITSVIEFLTSGVNSWTPSHFGLWEQWVPRAKA